MSDNQAKAYEMACYAPIKPFHDDDAEQHFCLKRHPISTLCNCGNLDRSYSAMILAGTEVRRDIARQRYRMYRGVHPLSMTGLKEAKTAAPSETAKTTAKRLAISPDELRDIKLREAQAVIETAGGMVDATDADWIEQLTGTRPKVKPEGLQL